MPQYRYAFDEHGHTVDVQSLPSEHSDLPGSFTCLGCGAPLVAKIKGEKRERHFAHKAATSTCTEETYLHRLAKQVFLDEYHSCLASHEPFEIELTYPKRCQKYKDLGHSCCIGTLTKAHDLTQYYDGIKLEQRDGSFVPDLLLYSSHHQGRTLYVEIAVTHFLSEEKAASDHKIIEIPVESEADVAKIRGRRLSQAEASFVNFKFPAAAIVDAECKCEFEPYYCLLVYTSGKSYLLHAPLVEIAETKRQRSAQVEYARLLPAPDVSEAFARGGVYFDLLQEAAESGYPVRNCFLCRYAGVDRSWKSNTPVFCRYLKKSCTSNEAVTCDAYRVKAKDQ